MLLLSPCNPDSEQTYIQIDTMVCTLVTLLNRFRTDIDIDTGIFYPILEQRFI